MKHAEKITPLAAALSAITTLMCCVPMGFTAAVISATLAAAIAPYRSWLLGGSIALLALGTWQYVRARRSCSPPGPASFVIWALSAVVVCLVVFFPQVVASVVADWMP